MGFDILDRSILKSLMLSIINMSYLIHLFYYQSDQTLFNEILSMDFTGDFKIFIIIAFKS